MMATTAASAPPSNEELYLSAYRRIRAARSRPCNRAADEFFAESEDWRTLPRRLERLCQVLNQWNADNGSDELPCSLSQDPKESRRLSMTASVMVKAPPSFLSSFQKLFRNSLSSRQDSFDGGGNDMDTDEEKAMFQSLRTLGWIRASGGELMEPLGDALNHVIMAHTRKTISGEFEEGSLFQSVTSWQDAVVVPWVRELVGEEAYAQDNWSERLSFAAAECFCFVRMEEMFELVTEYPDSYPAVIELRDVLERTRMHSQLGEALQSSLTKRLIHPGANTSQIIDVYINTIKVLREFDPSDRLLDQVAGPVRCYLRGRNDTVRCIITSLTDEEAGGDLYEELRREDARPLEHAQVDSDDEEEPPDMNWMPPPPLSRRRHSMVLSSGSRGSGSDILSMLVSIYGSKELFVNEYRLMLADKLLANLDFDTDKEVHTLELLKLRFGELSMRQCEIMIKDTDDSKRIISNIHSTIKTKKSLEPVADAAIVSHIFWPALQKEHLKHHPRIQAELDEFSEEYGKLKNPRRLVWFNQLGTVQMELDVVEVGPDGVPAVETREFTCSPLLATLISHFEDKDRWSSEDLANEAGIADHIVQKRMAYWINNRVVQVVPSVDPTEVKYELTSREQWLEAADYGPGSLAASMTDEDANEGQAVSAGAQEEEEMEVYESYIVGMLSNLGQLPLDRIHNMLKMFVTSGSDHKYNKTPQQLSAFLQILCRKEKLECGPDGMYKLFKK